MQSTDPLESDDGKRTIHVSRRGSITIQEPNYSQYLGSNLQSLGIRSLQQNGVDETLSYASSIVSSNNYNDPRNPSFKREEKDSSRSSGHLGGSSHSSNTGSRLDLQQLKPSSSQVGRNRYSRSRRTAKRSTMQLHQQQQSSLCSLPPPPRQQHPQQRQQRQQGQQRQQQHQEDLISSSLHPLLRSSNLATSQVNQYQVEAKFSDKNLSRTRISSALQSSKYHPPTPVSTFASAYAPATYAPAPVAQQFNSEFSVNEKVLDRLSNRVDQSFDLMRKNNTMKI
jgi:hypothetical protein